MKANARLWLLSAMLLSSSLSAQSVDEIVAKSIEARGGKERILALSSIRMSGQMTLSEELQAPFSWEWQRPGRFRVQFTVQDKTGIQAFDGKTAWIQVPFAGKPNPERLSDDVTRAVASEADFDGHLVNYGEKGHKVELLPEGEVKGKKVQRLLVTLESGDFFLYSLDAETYLPVQTEGRVFLGDSQVDSVSLYSDYREVNGLQFPHQMESRLKSQPEGRKLTVEKIEIDPDIDESRFAYPGDDQPSTNP